MRARQRSYSSCVFLNCPFDEAYRPIRDALVFAIYDCGFVPRSSLEESDSGDVRIDKIMRIIAECMKVLSSRYDAFRSTLPGICRKLGLERAEMTYNDYSTAVADWLDKQAP